jgi:hypothetical protein
VLWRICCLHPWSAVQLRILTEEPGKDEVGAAPEDQFDDVFLRRIEGSMLSQVALQVRQVGNWGFHCYAC